MKIASIVREGHTYTMTDYKVHPRMSEETICFDASLSIDGIRFADIRNRGCGGAHDIYPVKPWEEWMRDVDFEGIINDLLDHLEEQEFIRKNEDKGIILKKVCALDDGFSCPDYSVQRYRIGGKHVKISLLIANGYLEKIQADAQKCREEGYEVLNTNF